MYDTVCTLPLSSELFTQALHPTDTVLAVGLASGHVQTYRLPATGHGGHDDEEVNNGFGKVERQWRTKRHQGSCRSLTFSPDGEVLFSAGTDGVLKAASSRTGQVSSKIAIPTCSSAQRSSVDIPTYIHALSAQTLLVATESSALHVYDLRQQSSTSSSASIPSTPNFSLRQKPQQTHHPHDDYVSSITPLPPPGHANTASRLASGAGGGASSNSSIKQFITTGATTLAVTDLRRGVLSRSEDQEEELLSSVFVTGLPARRGGGHGINGKGGGGGGGDKAIVGGADGVLTLWDRGHWDDQVQRILLNKAVGGSESVDALLLLPDDVGPVPERRHIAAGMGDGSVSIVSLFPHAVVCRLDHDDLEAVTGLGVDCSGRLFTGGGQNIKIWIRREAGGAEDDDEYDDDDDDDDDDDEGDSNASDERVRRTGLNGTAVAPVDAATDANGASTANGSDNDSGDDDSDGSAGGQEKKKKRKRKRKRGKAGQHAKTVKRQPSVTFHGID